MKSIIVTGGLGFIGSNLIDLLISKNDKVVILGESGSGKSTILDILTGLVKPDKGSIKLDNIKKVKRLIEIWGAVQLLSKNEIIFITKVANDGKIKRIKWLPPKIYFILEIIKFLLSKMVKN